MSVVGFSLGITYSETARYSDINSVTPSYLGKNIKPLVLRLITIRLCRIAYLWDLDSKRTGECTCGYGLKYLLRNWLIPVGIGHCDQNSLRNKFSKCW